MNGSNVPNEINRYAHAIANDLYSTPETRQDFVRGFSEGFKSSLLLPESPHLEVISRIEARDAGFRKGRTIGLKTRLPAELRNVSLASYGYEQTEAKGLIYLNFEQQDFRLLGNRAAWWIAGSQVDLEYDSLQTGIPPIDQRYSIYACVQAMVSPLGTHGHFGAYEREMMITSVDEIRLATPSEIKTRQDLESQPRK